MHTDKRTIKDTMGFILIMQLGNMQLNDERYDTDNNMVNVIHRSVIGVHRCELVVILNYFSSYLSLDNNIHQNYRNNKYVYVDFRWDY